jgi:hypothetical protein
MRYESMMPLGDVNVDTIDTRSRTLPLTLGLL